MSMRVSDLMSIADFDFNTCEAIEAHFPDEFAVRTADLPVPYKTKIPKSLSVFEIFYLQI